MEFTPAMQQAMKKAMQLAHACQSAYIGTEHLLAALMQNTDSYASHVLKKRGLSAEKIEQELQRVTHSDPTSSLETRKSGMHGKEALPQSKKLRAVLHSAAQETRGTAQRVGSEHVLFAMLSDPTCAAARYLIHAGIDTSELFEQTEQFVQIQVRSDQAQVPENTESSEEKSQLQADQLLKQLTVDMTQEAAAGHYSPLIGREKELTEVITVLLRKNKNNPCLIGEAGVGKTAIVEGLAARIADKKVPPALCDCRILSLSLATVVAGTKYRGEFEQKLQQILQAVETHGKTILFIDELHTMMGAGGADGAIDASNMLKPSLARGTLRLIGATTWEEYRKHIEKDKAMERRFAPIRVSEPTEEETLRMLRGLRPSMEKHHAVVIDNDALQAAITLSCRYLKGRYLPDKAIDLIDEAAARACTQNTEGYDKNAFVDALKKGNLKQAQTLRKIASDKKSRLHITQKDIVALLSEKTSMPIGEMTQGEREKLTRLPAQLKTKVFGQEKAIQTVCQIISQNRLGLGKAHAPIASFLLIGPRSTGKSTLARALADTLFGGQEALIAIDPAAYPGGASLHLLLGAPPGYVGHEENGILTEAVRRRPYSVVLFEKITSADTALCGLVEQICTQGTLTDGSGHRTDFSGTVVFITADETSAPKIGFFANELKTNSSNISEEVEYSHLYTRAAHLLPRQLLRALDTIIALEPLDQQALWELAKHELHALIAQGEKIGLHIVCDTQVEQQIAKRALESGNGASGVVQIIQDEIAAPIAKRIVQKSVPHTPLFLHVGCDGQGRVQVQSTDFATP